ncbi:MAG: undecaprenyldiphospho-muramoylpentapeptide beta-N-acetylglucosaminyltransferase [Thermodesulfobacteriota bacterium]
MRIIIAGGGTGGHIFPALSIAEAIKSRSTENEILFVGTKNGLENEIIPDRGYKMEFINSGGIIGKGIMYKIKAVVSAMGGIISSFKILRAFKPDVVLGVGGYVSGPTVLTAYLNFIPTAICEQNTVPGITNRILSRFSNKIFLNFVDSTRYFPENKTVLTGNPVRTDFTKSNNSYSRKSGEKTIFIIGGSQGASKLNMVVPLALTKVAADELEIFHQTGKKDVDKVVEIYDKLNLNSNVFSFKNDIVEIYKKSDLIISRSGAGTISEITAMGKASILIPFPHAAHNHQLFNAKFMENSGASVIIEDGILNESNLSNEINDILYTEKLNKMSDASSKLAKPDAANQIVEELYSLMGRK